MAEENKNKIVELTQDKPEEFSSDLEDIKDEAERTKRSLEKSLVSGSGSVAVRQDGQINLSAGNYSQIKANPNGTVETIGLQSINKANRYKIDTDDFILNNHKLNNKIYELADYKVVLEQEYPTTPKIAGGITMLGTVLTRAWDINLKRYVMIRRLVNIPLFSPSLGSTDVLPGLKITPNTEQIKEMKEAFNTAGITSMEDIIAKNRKERQDLLAEKEKIKQQEELGKAKTTTENKEKVDTYSPNELAKENNDKQSE